MVLRPLGVPDVIVADEAVALDARALGSRPAAEHPVGQHRLADVHAPVVDEVHLPQLGSRLPEDPRKALSDRVVPEMADVEGLVRIRA
jgi:hypothetical protein